MKNTIRAFIAISLKTEIQQTLSRVQEQLKELDNHAKWVKSENIHLTLKFLGDVLIEDINKIKKELEHISKNSEGIKIELTRLGAFPNAEDPRILWVGLKDDDHRIFNLASILEDKFEQLGFKKESRPFSHHITIGRTRSPENLKALSSAISRHSFSENPIQNADHITLYKSTLTSAGPIYETLGEFNFINT